MHNKHVFSKSYFLNQHVGTWVNFVFAVSKTNLAVHEDKNRVPYVKVSKLCRIIYRTLTYSHIICEVPTQPDVSCKITTQSFLPILVLI